MKNGIEEKVKVELIRDLSKLADSNIKDKDEIKKKIINRFVEDCLIIFPEKNRFQVLKIINSCIDEQIGKRKESKEDYDYQEVENNIDFQIEKIIIKMIRKSVNNCYEKEELENCRNEVLKDVYEQFPDVDHSFAKQVVYDNTYKEWLSIKVLRPLIELKLYTVLELADESTDKEFIESKREAKAKCVSDFVIKTKKNIITKFSVDEIESMVMKELYHVEKEQREGQYFSVDEKLVIKNIEKFKDLEREE